MRLIKLMHWAKLCMSLCQYCNGVGSGSSGAQHDDVQQHNDNNVVAVKGVVQLLSEGGEMPVPRDIRGGREGGHGLKESMLSDILLP